MPGRFTVVLTATFVRDLERLPLAVRDRITREIKRLEADPFGPPPKIKKLRGKGIGQWRLEVRPFVLRNLRNLRIRFGPQMPRNGRKTESADSADDAD